MPCFYPGAARFPLFTAPDISFPNSPIGCGGSLRTTVCPEGFGYGYGRAGARIGAMDQRLRVLLLLLLLDAVSVLCGPGIGRSDEHTVSAAVESALVLIGGEIDGGERVECGAALLQGRRGRQEDRVLCMVDVVLPPFGGVSDTKVSLYAVFDGHGGDEASQLASQSLHERFLHHLHERVRRSLSASHSSKAPGLPPGDQEKVRVHQATRMHECNSAVDSSTGNANRTDAGGDVFVQSALGVVLKEALAGAIADVESSFLVEAEKRGLEAGSTACVVLQADDYLLVASLGDSKALLCPAAPCSSAPDTSTSESLDTRRREILNRRLMKMKSRKSLVGACEGGPSVLELTRDHHPDREDEKLRVEAAGGFVVDYGGLPRVNGLLAVSRSIGDLAFKKFGVTAEPEWTGWLKIGSNASYLVISSDGIYERLTTREVCSVVSAVISGTDVSAALGLAQVTEPPIALPPRMPKLNGEENSRAIVPVPDGNIGFASSHLVDAERQRIFFSEADLTSEYTPGLIEEYSSVAPESDLQHEERHDWKKKFGAGSEVVPLTPERSATVLAKAIVDAAFRSGSRDNLAAIVVPLRAGVRDGRATFNKGHAAHKGSETVSKSVPTFIDISGSLKDGEFVKDESLIISGMLVRGIEDGDCYELIDTVVGSSILPWRPVIEFTSNENFNEAFEPVLERLPASAAHERVAGGQLEIYREHLLCTPKVTKEGDIKEVCLPPEGLARFLNLIGSIPLDKQRLLPRHWDIEGRPRGPKSTPPYTVNHDRYMLQKNFARGAFGEIWLALKRPCVKEDMGDEFFPVHNASQQTNFSVSQHTNCSESGFIPRGKYSSKHPSSGDWPSGHFRRGDAFILKRIMVEKGGNAYLSGLREKHFGEILLNEFQVYKEGSDGHVFSASGKGSNHKDSYWASSWSSKKILEFFSVANMSSQAESAGSGLDHIARYVESFEWPGKELWLVFHCEGKSLSSLLYSGGVDAEDDRDLNGFKVVQPSPWWRWLKRTEDGRMEMRSIIHQLLLAVKGCHDRNITHRDIKPENMVVSTDRGRGNDWPSNLTVRIIDFGSAIDRYSLEHLYGSSGPSQAEQTIEYAPPEATLSQHWLYFHPHQAHVYDMWSIGIVMLELVLGTPHVFQISSRTRVLLDQQLEGMDEQTKKTIYLLRAYLEMCILLPGIPPQHHRHHPSGSVEQSEEVRLAAWKCTEESVMQQIKQRDPLGIGMPDVWALRLLRELLQWYPEDRISVDEALKHPYFHPNQQ